MKENVTVVFRGFLNLSAKEKLTLVDSINEYFDSMKREEIREENTKEFEKFFLNKSEKKCVCCNN